MRDAIQGLEAIAPALAFLVAAVPFARLLGELGFFEAVVDEVAHRGRAVSVGWFWALAAATTAVLNLDTTVVLLTPLAIGLARHADEDPLPFAVVPLLLAGLASSFLPVSNLTTLIVVDRLDVEALDVLRTLGPASAVAVAVGWLAHRRRVPRRIVVGHEGDRDLRALRLGGAVVALLVVWFTVGEALGLPPWCGLVLADVVLWGITGSSPWRDLPLRTAAVVGAVAAALGAIAPEGVGSEAFWAADGALHGVGVVGASVVVANLVNNVPATLLAAVPGAPMTDGRWLWLLGVNIGSLLLPSGTLAALLWWRLVDADGVPIDLRRYVRSVAPVVLPALAAATAVALLSL